MKKFFEIIFKNETEKNYDLHTDETLTWTRNDVLVANLAIALNRDYSLNKDQIIAFAAIVYFEWNGNDCYNIRNTTNWFERAVEDAKSIGSDSVENVVENVVEKFKNRYLEYDINNMYEDEVRNQIIEYLS